MDSFVRDVSSKSDGHGDDKHTLNQKRQQQKPSSSELFSSVKTVAGAAKATFSNQEFDRAKAAGAAANLLDAASQYGKLEEDKGLGKVVNKAENYLYKYSQTTTSSSTTATGGAEHGKSGGGYGEYAKLANEFLNKQSGGDHNTAAHGGSTTGAGHSGTGGYGEYMKMAGDFLNKQSGDHHRTSTDHAGSTTQSEGLRGDSGSGFMKMAGDFLKEH